MRIKNGRSSARPSRWFSSTPASHRAFNDPAMLGTPAKRREKGAGVLKKLRGLFDIALPASRYCLLY